MKLMVANRKCRYSAKSIMAAIGSPCFVTICGSPVSTAR
jgi:hypothetical protein